jgi:hypothetical protein
MQRTTNTHPLQERVCKAKQQRTTTKHAKWVYNAHFMRATTKPFEELHFFRTAGQKLALSWGF